MDYKGLAEHVRKELDKNENVASTSPVQTGGERVPFGEFRVVLAGGDILTVKVKQVMGGLGK